MTESKKNVFEQLQESLALIAEELHNANDALYVVATETMDLNEKLGILSSKLDAIIGAATKVAVEKKETPVMKKPEVPAFSFKELKKEMK